MGSRANKYLIAITDGHPALQDELTGNLISARREAEQPFQDHRMPYVFNGPLQFHVGENRSREQKRLGYPAASSEAAALRVHFAEEVQMQVSGTEKGTDVVFLHTTVDDGDHFQQILAWTLKSRWQQQNELLREITRSFRSEK